MIIIGNVDIFSFLTWVRLLVLILIMILSFIATWIIRWTQDAQNERFFKNVFKETSELNLVKNFEHDIPPGIIYYTHTPQSKFRRELKKLYYKIKKIDTQHSIIPYDDKEDMIYKVILDAFSYLPGLSVVYKEFADSLVYFLAYRYVLRKNIPPKISERFREKFKKSKYYEMVKSFGDKEYCDNIVLNPALEKAELRDLITEIILPLMRYSSKRLHEEQAELLEYEKKSEDLIEFFEGLHNGLYFVLYVGRSRAHKYINLLKKNIEGKSRGFIVGVSSNHYTKMSNIITFINPILREEWGDDYVTIDDEEGFDENKDLMYRYMIFRHCKEIKRLKFKERFK